MSFHQILASLPGVGPLPRQFSASGSGMYREGFVVEFCVSEGRQWIGNFQPGLTDYSAVFSDETTGEATVFSGGQAYGFNARTDDLIVTYGGVIQRVFQAPNSGNLLICSPTDFELRCLNGRLIWRSRRVSWDGFRSISIHVEKVEGEAWMFDDTWQAFTLDLNTGGVEGGSYYER